MDEPELEGRLGRFKAEYTSALGKIVINVILALVWFVLGYGLASMLWDSYNSQGAAIGVGLFFLVTGLGYVIIPFLRRFGRKARLHEEGVWISIRGDEQAWRFDEIEGVRVIPSRSSTMAFRVLSGTGDKLGETLRELVAAMVRGGIDAEIWVRKLARADVAGYEFYVGGERVIEVKPLYKRWKELGAEVFLVVITGVISSTVERVKRGEPVIYDKFAPDRALHVWVAAEVIKQLEWQARFGAT